MKNLLNIIGALMLVAAAILAQLFNFPADTVIEIALAAFGITAIIIAAIKDAKEKQHLNWITYLIIILSVLGGILICVGGAASSVITTIVGAAVALVSVIIALITLNKK